MKSLSERARATVHGAVQGVGFRPFVHRLATDLGLTGWVCNTAQGVSIEAEGSGGLLRQFLMRLEQEKPPQAMIRSLEFSFLDAVGYEGFIIRESGTTAAKGAYIQPDSAPCPYCLHEIFQTSNRRHRYPFTNCSHCGPRFTIIEALPYDRSHTSMKGFKMCSLCEREYNDPADRRFHAQPNACASCGPQLELWDSGGNVLVGHDEAMHHAAEDIRQGKIVALKGVGGFQLLCDARNEKAVRKLRLRKHRAEKPFALMYPSITMVRRDCHVSELEERLLLSAEAPIVLLDRWSPPLAPSIAPGNPSLGIMLPSSPLHSLLMHDLGFPIVATSGNVTDEPICIDEHEAISRLGNIADVFLVHNRPIVRPLDDSIVRVVRGREMVLRRARGFAPLPVHLAAEAPSILALGGDLKNSVALSRGHQIFLSQHVGDLQTPEAHASFRAIASDLPHLYNTKPEIIACDLQPDQLPAAHAAEMAADMKIPVHPVQHHWAHVLSCMVENEVEFPALGVAWDGIGYGPDGTMWGGEFLLAKQDGFERVAHLRQFPLPDATATLLEPRRAALGLLYEFGGLKALEQDDLFPVREFSETEMAAIRQTLSKRVNAPITSSVGRLFDAVSALAGLRQVATYDAQAAMSLEFAIQPCECSAYPFAIKGTSPSEIDWRPMLEELLKDVREGETPNTISAKFHNALVQIIVAVAKHVGETRVVLSGGCFQNRYLTERSVQHLIEAGFRPYWHQRIPTNDGGIAVGQVADAARRRERKAAKVSRASAVKAAV